MIRVVLTGSESTGKTTLAARLAAHYGAALVPEFVRDYVTAKGAPVEFADHGPIARGQMALEDAHTGGEAQLVIQDTDLLSTVVYSEHYFGSCPAWIGDELARRRPDLYLLCDIDVPWIADDVRDRGHMREEMQALFRAAVAATVVPTAAIHGDWTQRFQRAVDAIDAILLAAPPSA